MSFDQFRFDPRIAAGVRASGYEVATPIQAATIPPVMEGRDVMGLAQTGTGKTAAYALPALHRMLSGPRGVLRTLVLAPTRELAEQIGDSFRTLGHQTGLTHTTVYGGVGIEPQVRALRRGTDIVVACPGRLLDHIGRRTINLSKIDMLVLDEADMMLDMGFLPDVRRILSHLPRKRQNLMFSATMPEAIKRLSSDILNDHVTASIKHSKPTDTVTQALYPVPQHLKTSLILGMLDTMEMESVLVFTRTKHLAKRLGGQLVKEGHRAVALQGNMSQNARQNALAGFRSGKYNILVATDIAARGIDVSQISHVINYDVPATVDAYTHRIGRTGRALRTGHAFTFVTRDDEEQIRAIERVLGGRIERCTCPGFMDDASRCAVPAREPRRDARPRTDSRPRRADAGSPPQSRSHARPHGASQPPRRHDAPGQSQPAQRPRGARAASSSPKSSAAPQWQRPNWSSGWYQGRPDTDAKRND